MKDEEILKLAIKKANIDLIEMFGVPQSFISYKRIIFSHDFAKAFWGTWKEKDPYLPIIKDTIEYWQYHLQQMVLEPEPLKYLAKFVKEENLA